MLDATERRQCAQAGCITLLAQSTAGYYCALHAHQRAMADFDRRAARLERLGRPPLPQGRWAINFDRCEQCGETTRKHKARGLCSLCFKRSQIALALELSAPRKRKASLERWAKAWDCCRECGLSNNPHKARGFCTACYYQAMQRDAVGRSWQHPTAPACRVCGTAKYAHRSGEVCTYCWNSSSANRVPRAPRPSQYTCQLCGKQNAMPKLGSMPLFCPEPCRMLHHRIQQRERARQLRQAERMSQRAS